MSTGQWIPTADGDTWYFDAGAESLDFASTGPVGQSPELRETLHSPHDLGAWLAARVPTLRADDVTERDLADALMDSVRTLPELPPSPRISLSGRRISLSK